MAEDIEAMGNRWRGVQRELERVAIPVREAQEQMERIERAGELLQSFHQSASATAELAGSPAFRMWDIPDNAELAPATIARFQTMMEGLAAPHQSLLDDLNATAASLLDQEWDAVERWLSEPPEKWTEATIRKVSESAGRYAHSLYLVLVALLYAMIVSSDRSGADPAVTAALRQLAEVLTALEFLGVSLYVLGDRDEEE